MKFLFLFAVGVLFGCVQCDKECFRAVFKECARDAVPKAQMTLCDEIKDQIDCLARYATNCSMKFSDLATKLQSNVDFVCTNPTLETLFKRGKPCYQKNLIATECVEPINEAMKGIVTSEDYIRSNKKVCNLFGAYSKCVNNAIIEDCEIVPWAYFSWVYDPLSRLSDALCEELILSADEKDSRPDNFGNLNVFASVTSIFFAP